MTPQDDFIGQLEGYFDEYEGPTPLPEGIRDAVRAQLPKTRQIGLLPGPMRYEDMMSKPIQFAIAAAAVVLAVVIGISLLSGPNIGNDPEQTASPTATATADGSPTALPPGEGPLDAGTYSLDTSFPVGITFEVPDGWRSCSEGEVDQGVCLYGDPRGVGVSFLIVDNVVADPCGPINQLIDPPVGPSVDDLVTAISNLEGFEATAATDVTVDGFSGKQFTVTAPEVEGCGATWVVGDRTNGVGPAEVNEMRILDIDGVRAVISGSYFVGASEEQLSALHSVIASIQIAP
jgi:hypothetical protein